MATDGHGWPTFFKPEADVERIGDRSRVSPIAQGNIVQLPLDSEFLSLASSLPKIGVSQMKRALYALMLLAMSAGAALAEMAWVNSPRDGFLALRSQPSAKEGVRLSKVPHATQLALAECVSTSTADRWCRTTYDGQSGWVFARFLTKGNEPVADIYGAVQTPRKGDPVRTAILDAIRSRYPRRVTFQVDTLRISDPWAWAVVTAAGKDGAAYESEACLLQKVGASWKVVGGVNGGADEDVAHAAYRDLRRKFPEAPQAIFE